MIRCDCGSSWTSLRMAHCAACHATFSTVGNFDRHRQGGRCVEPGSVPLVADSRGVWRQPGDDAHAAAVFARTAS